jgi:hypothetical protein
VIECMGSWSETRVVTACLVALTLVACGSAHSPQSGGYLLRAPLVTRAAAGTSPCDAKTRAARVRSLLETLRIVREIRFIEGGKMAHRYRGAVPANLSFDPPVVAVLCTPLRTPLSSIAALRKTAVLVIEQRVTLTLALAKRLARYRGRRLQLELRHLSANAAQALAKWPGQELELDGLEQLSPAAARHLARWPGAVLELDRLQRLSASSARALGGWRGLLHKGRFPQAKTFWGRLTLRGLGRLSKAAARELARWPGSELRLDGLRALSPDAAAALAMWPGSQLHLDGLPTLSPALARALARWPGKRLSLRGVGRWSPQSERLLATGSFRTQKGTSGTRKR